MTEILRITLDVAVTTPSDADDVVKESLMYVGETIIHSEKNGPKRFYLMRGGYGVTRLEWLFGDERKEALAALECFPTPPTEGE